MNVTQASVSAKRIREVLAEKPRIAGVEKEADAAIPARQVRLERASFSYDGPNGPLVLREIDIEASRGETVAIIGATGAGKSTLVQLIPRLYDVTSGSVRIDGKDIRELPLIGLRRRIGMILQESFLFTGTIRDNIAFGKSDATQEEIEAAAATAQAHDFIARLPDGYDTQLGQRGVNLSGGQKQRLSIARALLIRPPILIMDDSTSALDLGTERRLRTALEGIAKDAVTFLIAQRISSVMEAQKILVLDEGEIAGVGTHEQLLASCEVYRDIYRSQYGKQEEVSHVGQPTVQSL
jgi:ATP-binding cassette subfamily B protein